MAPRQQKLLSKRAHLSASSSCPRLYSKVRPDITQKRALSGGLLSSLADRKRSVANCLKHSENSRTNLISNKLAKVNETNSPFAVDDSSIIVVGENYCKNNIEFDIDELDNLQVSTDESLTDQSENNHQSIVLNCINEIPFGDTEEQIVLNPNQPSINSFESSTKLLHNNANSLTEDKDVSCSAFQTSETSVGENIFLLTGIKEEIHEDETKFMDKQSTNFEQSSRRNVNAQIKQVPAKQNAQLNACKSIARNKANYIITSMSKIAKPLARPVTGQAVFSSVSVPVSAKPTFIPFSSSTRPTFIPVSASSKRTFVPVSIATRPAFNPDSFSTRPEFTAVPLPTEPSFSPVSLSSSVAVVKSAMVSSIQSPMLANDSAKLFSKTACKAQNFVATELFKNSIAGTSGRNVNCEAPPTPVQCKSTSDNSVCNDTRTDTDRKSCRDQLADLYKVSMSAIKTYTKVDKEDPRSRLHFVKYMKKDGKTLKKWECGICGREFIHQYMLMRHLPTHTDERNFQCKECGKAFRQMSTLSQHRATHSKSRPYVCEICKKTFNRVSTLISHKKIHADIKQHVCNICGKAFHQRGNLKNHMFIHTNERPYKCNLCGRGFNQASNLHSHRDRAHAEELSDSVLDFTISTAASANVWPHLQSADISPKKQEQKSGRRPAACHECPICLKEFGSSLSVSKHMSAVHQTNSAPLSSQRNSSKRPFRNVNFKEKSGLSKQNKEKVVGKARVAQLNSNEEISLVLLQDRAADYLWCRRLEVDENFSSCDEDFLEDEPGVLIPALNSSLLQPVLNSTVAPLAMLRPVSGEAVVVKVVTVSPDQHKLVPVTAEELKTSSVLSVSASDSKSLHVKIPIVATVVQYQDAHGGYNYDVLPPEHDSSSSPEKHNSTRISPLKLHGSKKTTRKNSSNPALNIISNPSGYLVGVGSIKQETGTSIQKGTIISSTYTIAKQSSQSAVGGGTAPRRVPSKVVACRSCPSSLASNVCTSINTIKTSPRLSSDTSVASLITSFTPLVSISSTASSQTSSLLSSASLMSMSALGSPSSSMPSLVISDAASPLVISGSPSANLNTVSGLPTSFLLSEACVSEGAAAEVVSDLPSGVLQGCGAEQLALETDIIAENLLNTGSHVSHAISDVDGIAGSLKVVDADHPSALIGIYDTVHRPDLLTEHQLPDGALPVPRYLLATGAPNEYEVVSADDPRLTQLVKGLGPLQEVQTDGAELELDGPIGEFVNLDSMDSAELMTQCEGGVLQPTMDAQASSITMLPDHHPSVENKSNVLVNIYRPNATLSSALNVNLSSNDVDPSVVTISGASNAVNTISLSGGLTINCSGEALTIGGGEEISSSAVAVENIAALIGALQQAGVPLQLHQGSEHVLMQPVSDEQQLQSKPSEFKTSKAGDAKEGFRTISLVDTPNNGLHERGFCDVNRTPEAVSIMSAQDVEELIIGDENIIEVNNSIIE